MKLGELKSAIRKVKGPVGATLYIPGKGAFPFPLVKGPMIDTIDALFSDGNRGTETGLSIVNDVLVMEGMTTTFFVPDPDSDGEVSGGAPDSGTPEEIGEPDVEEAEEIGDEADGLADLMDGLDDLLG